LIKNRQFPGDFFFCNHMNSQANTKLTNQLPGELDIFQTLPYLGTIMPDKGSCYLHFFFLPFTSGSNFHC